jgi:DNA-binding MarR family transcriptional regulator
LTKKKLYVTELMDLLRITKPQMTASVDKHLSLGYVERKNDSKDRRKIYLSLTKDGIEIVSKINMNIDLQLRNNLINHHLKN